MAYDAEHRKIDQTLANSLKPGPEKWYWDTEIKQFAIRVRPRSVQYLLRKRLKGEQRTWVIGEVSSLKASVARERVITARLLVDDERDPEDWLREQERGKLPPRPEVKAAPLGWSFGEMLAGYLESDKRTHRSKKSKAEYEGALLRSPEIVARHQLACSEVTSLVISDIRDELRRRVTPQRTKRLLDYLSGAFNWAKKEPRAMISANPIDDVNLPEGKSKPKDRWLTVEEIKHVLAAVTNEPMDSSIRHLLLLALLTGQRKGALLGARIADVHLDDSKAEEHGPHLILRDNKDGEDEHVVPLAPIAITLVNACREAAAKRKSAYLFPASRAPRAASTGSSDRPITDNAVNTAIERMVLSGAEKQERKDKAEAALIAKGKMRPRDPNRRGRGIRLVPLPPPSDGILHGKVAMFGLHDFRRTLSTNLATRRRDPEYGVVRWFVSVLLDHSVGKDHSEFRSNVTEDIYTVYDYIGEKRVAAETWAKFLINEAGLKPEAWLSTPADEEDEYQRSAA